MATDDPQFLEAIRNLPCIACNRPPKNEASHAKAKGMGRAYGDDWFNVFTLCAWCHRLAKWSWHQDFKWFIRKNPHVKRYLEQLGWEFFMSHGALKFVHPGYRDQAPKTQPEYTIKEINNGGSNEKV